MTALEFASCILTLAGQFRFSVTSWGRSVAHNTEVGGKPESFHLMWCAADVELDPGQNTAIFRIRADQLGIRVIDEDDHLHLQPKY